MATKTMWMVRADSDGRLFEDFKYKGVVAIGWDEMGDMSELKTRAAFADAVAAAYPEMTKNQRAAASGQPFRFVNEMRIGDEVVTYDPSARVYLVGEVTGDYRYERPTDPDFRMANLRSVQWRGEVPRDTLSAPTRNSLGALATLFQLSTEAKAEIVEKIGAKPPSPVLRAEEGEDTQIEVMFRDTQAKAFEFIKDHLNRLSWDEMQELVAGLLRAMGYKTRVSPAGPDRGKDIVASPDGFGFESPRIVVEVKHRSAPMGAQDVRSFLGGRHKDDKGLYVSTGGFSKDARYEADRASIPVTLMDLTDLVNVVLEYYERMDRDTQLLVPLRKVYWPAAG